MINALLCIFCCPCKLCGGVLVNYKFHPVPRFGDFRLICRVANPVLCFLRVFFQVVIFLVGGPRLIVSYIFDIFSACCHDHPPCIASPAARAALCEDFCLCRGIFRVFFGEIRFAVCPITDFLTGPRQDRKKRTAGYAIIVSGEGAA